ncbi:MAG: hypothetical protein AAFX76_04625, partial [Planctomycetota bacterium]
MSRQSNRRLRYLMAIRPRTPDELHRLIERGFGLRVPRTVWGAGSTPPFDYLCHAFFHGGDCVVWANRGGGKTMLGAVATLLDLLFKPGVQVRILGGSLEQSSKMYEHLTALLDRPLLSGPRKSNTLRDRGGVLAVPATARRVLLANGSRAEVLAGSQRSVRGVRVHKLRCDEVEEFDPAVWEAAQLVTRSGRCGERWVRGGVEGLSTMHKPFGLMSRLVDAEATTGGAELSGAGLKLPGVFRWNAMDVAGRCPEELACEGCVLWDDCGGRAKSVPAGAGFVPIEDLIAQRRRTSDRTWSAEMMCERPAVASSVYPDFDPTPGPDSPHVTPDIAFDGPRWVGGMDFGLRSPHVMLWAVAAPPASTDADPRDTPVHVVDEYVVAGL